jgi:hypothetical protein
VRTAADILGLISRGGRPVNSAGDRGLHCGGPAAKAGAKAVILPEAIFPSVESRLNTISPRLQTQLQEAQLGK